MMSKFIEMLTALTRLLLMTTILNISSAKNFDIWFAKNFNISFAEKFLDISFAEKFCTMIKLFSSNLIIIYIETLMSADDFKSLNDDVEIFRNHLIFDWFFRLTLWVFVKWSCNWLLNWKIILQWRQHI